MEIGESDKIYDDTLSLYEKFNPAKLKPMLDMSSTHSAAAQSLFYMAVRQGWETHGVELDEPTVAYVSITSKKTDSEDIEATDPSKSGQTVGLQRLDCSDQDTEDDYESPSDFIYHEVTEKGAVWVPSRKKEGDMRKLVSGHMHDHSAEKEEKM